MESCALRESSGHLGRPLSGAFGILGSLGRLLEDHLGLLLRVGAAGGQLFWQQVRALVHAVVIRTDGGACVGHLVTVREMAGAQGHPSTA